jgi:hypothetical protein
MQVLNGRFPTIDTHPLRADTQSLEFLEIMVFEFLVVTSLELQQETKIIISLQDFRPKFRD